MKELDFDELDKAVNSLMTDVPKTNKVQDDEPIKTLTISPPMADSATTPASSAPSTSQASAPSVAARRGGRFMDVVHPAADRKKPDAVKSPISRQGVTIAPSPGADVSPESSPTPGDSSQSVAELKKPEAVGPADTPTHANDWPDPLELANFKEEPVSESSDTKEPDGDQSELVEEPAPLTSPFLPDTKVEKRPLGGPAPSVDTASPETDESPDKAGEDFTTNDPTAQLPASPSTVEPQLPEELQSDLVRIESGASATKSPANDAEAEPKEDLSDKQDAITDSQPKTSAPETATEAKTSPSVSTGPASIPQQYREEPSTGDQANGAIYDTNAYHQPLAHPGKKKSGWLWVLWIVLILAVGAGIGAALYFLGIV